MHGPLTEFVCVRARSPSPCILCTPPLPPAPPIIILIIPLNLQFDVYSMNVKLQYAHTAYICLACCLCAVVVIDTFGEKKEQIDSIDFCLTPSHCTVEAHDCILAMPFIFCFTAVYARLLRACLTSIETKKPH